MRSYWNTSSSQQRRWASDEATLRRWASDEATLRQLLPVGVAVSSRLLPSVSSSRCEFLHSDPQLHDGCVSSLAHLLGAFHIFQSQFLLLCFLFRVVSTCASASCTAARGHWEEPGHSWASRVLQGCGWVQLRLLVVAAAHQQLGSRLAAKPVRSSVP